MTLPEITAALSDWTPFLAGGFAWNMVVSITAMAIGTPVGLALAFMRYSSGWAPKRSGNVLTAIARGAPTFVMLFYLVYVLPEQIIVMDHEFRIAAWFKASLALSIAVGGYVSDIGLSALHNLRRSFTGEAMLFIPSWTSYFMVIVMASSTASVVGVPEIVHRADTVIGAVNEPDFAIWVYLYAMIWFFAFGGIVSLIMLVLNRYVTKLRNRTRTTAAATGMP